MDIVMVVLIVYLLISNCYLHYKVLEIERNVSASHDTILELIFKRDKHK